jgi:Methyltransferase domain
VTAVDFAAAALVHARSTAQAAGPDVARRVDWVEADLETWTPQPGHYDLVTCLYVHLAGEVEEMVRRMGAGVAAGGTLFLVGHRPIDPASGAATPAAGQVQVSVEAAVAALDPRRWEFVRRRGSSAGRGRHRRRRRDTCAPSGVTVPLVCATSGTEQRLLRYQAK